MAGVNKAIILGHVGRDPEIKHTQAGKPVATFSIATSETWRDKDSGERKERTHWHNVVVWNEPLIKVIEQYVKKGSKLYIEGANETRKWTDQGGTDHYRTEIVLRAFNSTLVLLDRREGVPAPSDESFSGGERSSDFGSRSGAGAAGRANDMNDEIPF